MKKQVRYFAADFESTTYEGQTFTEVWAAACAELFSQDGPTTFSSIGDFYNYLCALNSNLIVYFHNLKFDGAFLLSYFLKDLGYKQAYADTSFNDVFSCEWYANKDMPDQSVKYIISDMGQWYSLTVRINNRLIEFRDSLKLLPFSLAAVGDSFKTKHRKLTMAYEGKRYAGWQLTPEEQEYLENDIYVLKEALEVMFTEGHTRLTIGSCCLSEYKAIIGPKKYKTYFPNVYELALEPEHNAPSVGAWVRKSYKGAWTYVAKGKACKMFYNGLTADVNSLYPSVMHSDSGNSYPVGEPIFWTGNYIPPEAMRPDRYYFVRIKTRFYLKQGKLPFIQIKNSFMYSVNEMLETSDIYNPKDNNYYSIFKNTEGIIEDARVELTLTCTDFQRVLEFYDCVDLEILDGCYFQAVLGIFDEYIDKYKQIKETSTGARRSLAKLFLNNLYGKMASSPNSSFKVGYVNDEGVIAYRQVEDNGKIPGYIPVGSAITSYARDFTIRHAQMNYHGPDKPGFIYADTDSLHCDLQPSELIGIEEHPTRFGCWKLESYWDKAWFTRQKTYIEHITHDDKEPVEPHWKITCAGMSDKSKELFVQSLTQEYTEQQFNEMPPSHQEFVKVQRQVSDFAPGLIVPGKLLQRRILGGVVLQNTNYKMR